MTDEVSVRIKCLHMEACASTKALVHIPEDAHVVPIFHQAVLHTSATRACAVCTYVSWT